MAFFIHHRHAHTESDDQNGANSANGDKCRCVVTGKRQPEAKQRSAEAKKEYSSIGSHFNRFTPEFDYALGVYLR